MKSLALAFVIVLSGAALTFGALGLFGVAQTIAGPISGLFLSAITYVHQVIEKKDPKAALTAIPKGIVALQGFFLPWYVIAVYSSLTLIAAIQLWAVVVGLATGLA